MTQPADRPAPPPSAPARSDPTFLRKTAAFMAMGASKDEAEEAALIATGRSRGCLDPGTASHLDHPNTRPA